jgi:flagellar FliJ protein
MDERPFSKRLQPLIELAELRESEAARSLSTKQVGLQAQQQRMRDLQGYVVEYSQAVPATTLPALVQNRAAFVERLAQAVVTQRSVLDRSIESCDLQRSRYLLASRSTEVLEKVAANHSALEAGILDRRNQRESDDLAGRSCFLNSSGEL